MKKLFVLVFLMSWVSFVIAQDEEPITVERNNVIKFLPANIPFQTISFEYERMVNANNSLTLGIGLPNQKSIMGKYGLDNSSDFKTAEFGTMFIRAAYRHYSGYQMLPKGFYIEPYLKYQNIKGNGSFTGSIDQTNGSYKGTLDLNLNTINIGFQLGAQFLIAKRITLDLYFLGLEAGILNGDVNATSDQLADPYAINLKADIEKAIHNLPSFIGDKLKVNQSADKKTINVNANNIPYPWLRGGISIGIAF